MSGNDWREFAKRRGGLVATFFFAALLIVSTAWPAWLAQTDIDRRAASNAARYTADAQGQIAQKCGILANQIATDCARQITAAARSQEREEYDLAAQETVAVWTTVMGSVAALGVSLSLVGVVLVWKTFQAQKEAIAQSRQFAEEAGAETAKALAHAEQSAAAASLQASIVGDTARKQLRAYVGFDGLFIGSGPETRRDRFGVILRNFGQTPAVRLTIRLYIAVGDLGSTVVPTRWRMGANIIRLDLQPSQPMARAIFFDKGEDYAFNRYDPTGSPWLKIVVSYTDIYNVRHKFTAIANSEPVQYQDRTAGIVIQGREHSRRIY